MAQSIYRPSQPNGAADSPQTQPLHTQPPPTSDYLNLSDLSSLNGLAQSSVPFIANRGPTSSSGVSLNDMSVDDNDLMLNSSMAESQAIGAVEVTGDVSIGSQINYVSICNFICRKAQTNFTHSFYSISESLTKMALRSTLKTR